MMLSKKILFLSYFFYLPALYSMELDTIPLNSTNQKCDLLKSNLEDAITHRNVTSVEQLLSMNNDTTLHKLLNTNSELINLARNLAETSPFSYKQRFFLGIWGGLEIAIGATLFYLNIYGMQNSTAVEKQRNNFYDTLQNINCSSYYQDPWDTNKQTCTGLLDPKNFTAATSFTFPKTNFSIATSASVIFNISGIKNLINAVKNVHGNALQQRSENIRTLIAKKAQQLRKKNGDIEV
jgi:hypothetical protein